MIVLAADVVGLEIVRFLVGEAAPIGVLVLEQSDPGGVNEELRSEVPGTTLVLDWVDLQNSGTLQALAERRPDLGVAAWWPHIIRRPLLDLPARGFVNLHPSVLPFNRGKHPNFWCLVDGTPCGVSIHVVDEGVDSGPVLAQRSISTTWEDTGQSIYERSRRAIVELFRETWVEVRELSSPIDQDPEVATIHRAAEIDNASRIDLDAFYTARDLFNRIRGRMYPPHPAASFEENGRVYTVEVLIRERPPSG
jgi:methionyl-tRNA formyltransferase